MFSVKVFLGYFRSPVLASLSFYFSFLLFAFMHLIFRKFKKIKLPKHLAIGALSFSHLQCAPLKIPFTSRLGSVFRQQQQQQQYGHCASRVSCTSPRFTSDTCPTPSARPASYCRRCNQSPCVFVCVFYLPVWTFNISHVYIGL